MTSSPYPTVLVGTAGSDSSLHAVDRAAVIASDATSRDAPVVHASGRGAGRG